MKPRLGPLASRWPALNVARLAASRWHAAGGLHFGAAIAFCATLAIAPLLVAAISAGSHAGGIGAPGASTGLGPHGLVLAGVLGAAALLLGTAGLCSTMRRALRAIGQAVPGAPGTRLRAGEKALLLAFVAGAVAIVSTSAGVYFVHADITSGIGVAGAFVVAMLGSCACTQALLFGAALAAEFDARATRGASPHRVAPPAASLDEARARRNPAARPCGARPINGSNNPWTRSPVKILRFPDERVRRDRTS